MKKVNINTLLYILILLFVIVLIMCRCISLHQNITENFEENENETETEMAELNNMTDEINAMEQSNNSNTSNTQTNKCLGNNQDIIHAAIISKYSGKIMNVEHLEKVENGDKESVNLYLIKWQPLGGKPGGCITCNSDGTFSTPICNLTDNSQKWRLKKIENEEQWKGEIKESRREMGRPFSSSNTEYPFYICENDKFKGFVLNYEGGGLSIREKANYDGQKWDVSDTKIKQDPLPTQQNNKFAGLTPGHKLTDGDKTLGGAFNSPLGNGGEDKKNTNLNVNLDPDLLSKLNMLLNNEGGMIGFGGASGSNNNNNDLIKSTGNNCKANNISGLLRNNNDKKSCEDCGKIPENYIKKDLVKSMCIGCNNIDNVLT